MIIKFTFSAFYLSNFRMWYICIISLIITSHNNPDLHWPLAGRQAPLSSLFSPGQGQTALASSFFYFVEAAARLPSSLLPIPELHWSKCAVRSSPHRANRSYHRSTDRRSLLANLPVPCRAAAPPPQSSAAAAELRIAASLRAARVELLRVGSIRLPVRPPPLPFLSSPSSDFLRPSAAPAMANTCSSTSARRKKKEADVISFVLIHSCFLKIHNK